MRCCEKLLSERGKLLIQTTQSHSLRTQLTSCQNCHVRGCQSFSCTRACIRGIPVCLPAYLPASWHQFSDHRDTAREVNTCPTSIHLGLHCSHGTRVVDRYAQRINRGGGVQCWPRSS